MIQVKKYNLNGEEIGQVELKDKLFNQTINKTVLHEYIKCFLSHGSVGTSAVKNRAMVSYSTRKMWRQKGTGRARSGSKRNPIWVGGGTIFGPTPGKRKVSINKKKKKIAFSSALSSKSENIIVLNISDLTKYSTKLIVNFLEKVNLFDKKLLVLHNELNEYFYKSSRNVKKLTVKKVSDINPYLILNSEYMIFTDEALNKLQEGVDND